MHANTAQATLHDKAAQAANDTGRHGETEDDVHRTAVKGVPLRIAATTCTTSYHHAQGIARPSTRVTVRVLPPSELVFGGARARPLRPPRAAGLRLSHRRRPRGS